MTENSAAAVAQRRWPAWTVPLVGAAAAVAVWLVGAALGVELEARTGASTQSVSVVAVLVAALVVGLAGWGVRAVLGRLTKGGGEVAWLVLCGVVLLGSLVGAASGTTPGAVAVLMAEHVAVGLVVALGLRYGSGTAARTS
ncbi:DUF6069 family protein [Promicromonospora sp. NPDC023987]|uniref:DUF6069 family protein n=1 Tax=Promicromonospora sp. NPDC023987 TaxID=3155360 RepID=UPI00340DBD53